MPQGLTGLYGAAGALQGLERLLMARELAKQQQFENQRALERERLAGRGLEEQTAFRQLQQQQLEQERVRDEAFRRAQLDQQQRLAQAAETGRAQRAHAAEAGRAERAEDLNALRRELTGGTARPPRFQFLQTPQGYVLGDPYSGQVQPVEAPGGGPLMPRPTGAERDTGESFADIKNIINTIKTNYDRSFVGPVQYRGRVAGQTFGISNPKFAAFRQAITALQNATTRLAFSSRASDQDVLRAIAEGANPALSEADFVRQLQGIEQRLSVREQAFRQQTGIR